MRFLRKVLKIPSYVFQRFIALGQRLYLTYYVIPRFRVGKIISGPVVIRHGFRCFIIQTRLSVIKVAAARNSTVIKDAVFFHKLKTQFPRVRSVLPEYERLDYLFISALKTERFVPVAPEEELPIAITIQKLLDEAGLVTGRLNLAECMELRMGIGYFRDTFGFHIGARLENIVVEFLKSGNYRVGLSHGDFHSRNVMVASDGSARIIDLDCVRLRGIRELDALYFSLEKEWSETGRLWVNTLLECIRGGGSKARDSLRLFKVEWSNDLAVIFFLDRIGQEYRNFQIRYPKPLLSEFLSALDCVSGPSPNVSVSEFED
jgi:hypothetical protein